MADAILPKCIYDPDASHAAQKLAIITIGLELKWYPEQALQHVQNAENAYSLALRNDVMAMCIYTKFNDKQWLIRAEQFAIEAYNAKPDAYNAEPCNMQIQFQY